MTASGKDLYDKGIACENAGDTAGAFEAFRQSARINPRVAAPYVGLARLLSRNHQRADTLACLDRAVACEPGNAAIWIIRGQTLSQDGQLEAARSAYEKALSLDANAIRAALGLGAVHEDLGDRAGAARIYQELLARAPDEAEAIAGLLGVASADALPAAINTAANRIQTASDADAALIGYALGKKLAKSGDHDGAFRAWSAANAARRRFAGPFDRAAFDARIDRLIEIFSPAFFAEREGWGEASEQPVFIVGLPRSGTTLTEQILSGHPDVFGAGELDLLTDMATGTPDRLGRADPPWPETALELTRTHVAGIARDHLARLAGLAPAGAGRVIDKQPLNFWHLGLVALAFPNARIIHCTRDMRDNGLSIFAENFTPEQRWATDLSDIMHYWRGYRRLMAHWQTALPIRMINNPYEAMVADLETAAQNLVSFLGLPWDERCLAFHEHERAVQTPSRWQVRQPVYATSVGRWRHYETEIGALADTAQEDAP